MPWHFGECEARTRDESFRRARKRLKSSECESQTSCYERVIQLLGICAGSSEANAISWWFARGSDPQGFRRPAFPGSKPESPGHEGGIAEGGLGRHVRGGGEPHATRLASPEGTRRQQVGRRALDRHPGSKGISVHRDRHRCRNGRHPTTSPSDRTPHGTGAVKRSLELAEGSARAGVCTHSGDRWLCLLGANPGARAGKVTEGEARRAAVSEPHWRP